MIRRFLAWLSGPSPLVIAKTEYVDALNAHHKARRRHATQIQHDTEAALRRATLRLLSVEMGR